MVGQYATGTKVSADRSMAEIERILMRYGARGFMYGRDDDRSAAMIAFRANDRQVRFMLPLPDRANPAFTATPTGRDRTRQAALDAYEGEVRRRWRALALAVKAKLEAVETGIVSFEDEFAAYIVLPNGSTVGEWLRPQIAEAYRTGRMPELLPMPGSGRLAITDGS